MPAAACGGCASVVSGMCTPLDPPTASCAMAHIKRDTCNESESKSGSEFTGTIQVVTYGGIGVALADVACPDGA